MNGRKQKEFLGPGFILSLLFLLTSCSYPHQKIIDDIQIPTVLGFDKGEEGFTGTVSYIDFTEEENDGNEVFLEADGKNAETILQKIDAQSSKPIEIGKLNLLVFGSELASEGISYFTSTICRDPLIGSNMFLAVAEGKAGELLKNGQKINSNYIYNLIEHNSKDQNLPKPALQSFLFDYYGEGRDGTLPYLKINQKNKMEVNGLAIFKNDQVKLFLDRKEAFLYKILKGRYLKGQTEFEIQKDDQKGVAVFTLLHGENKKIVSGKSENKVKFNIELQGMVKDYPEWLDLSEAKNNIFLKNEMEKRVKEDLENLLFKFKDYNVDPLGIGDLVRAHSRNWDEEEFYQNAYDNVTYEIDLNIELLRAGIGE